MEVDTENVKILIGKRGAKVKSMMEESGAKIFISNQVVDQHFSTTLNLVPTNTDPVTPFINLPSTLYPPLSSWYQSPSTAVNPVSTSINLASTTVNVISTSINLTQP